MKHTKKILKIKKQIQQAIDTVARLKIEAIQNNQPSLEKDCNLLYSTLTTDLHYINEVMIEQ